MAMSIVVISILSISQSMWGNGRDSNIEIDGSNYLSDTLKEKDEDFIQSKSYTWRG